MKKVLLSAYACSPIRGSEEGNGWSWATLLGKRGYDVWCFTNVTDKKEIEEAVEKLGLPNIHIVFISLGILDKCLLDPASKKIYFHYLLWKNKAAKVAKQMHKKSPFDIGHHVSYGSLQQGSYLWKLKGMKKIFGPVGGGQQALHILKDYFGKDWKTEELRAKLSKWGARYSRNYKNTIKDSDYILVTNKDTLDMVKATERYNPDKVFFVPDTAVPKLMENMPMITRPADKCLKLLWVGRMLPRKGLNLVLEALAQVPADINYSLTIVGGGPQFHLIDGWIKEYGLHGSKIKIIGQVQFAEMIEYYKRADVFIFCSLRDSYAAQFTEAMAFGLPVITLNIHGAVMGVPDNCGIKINPVTKESTLKDIADAVVRMCNEPDYRKDLSINAYNYSKNNTWDRKVDEVVQKFYEA